LTFILFTYELLVKEIFGCGLGDLPVVIRINEKEQEEVGIIF